MRRTPLGFNPPSLTKPGGQGFCYPISQNRDMGHPGSCQMRSGLADFSVSHSCAKNAHEWGPGIAGELKHPVESWKLRAESCYLFRSVRLQLVQRQADAEAG